MSDERGLIRQEMGVQNISSAETAIAAVSAREKARIESAYVVAMRNPRDWMDVRSRLLKHCDRPGFAEKARYKKPTGKAKINGEWKDTFAEGLTVRFAEAARSEMGNLISETEVTYEDDNIRIVRASVLDLERNNYEGRSLTLTKVTEKRGKQDFKTKEWAPPEGREVVGQRVNTYGDPVYICKATEDEVRLRMNSEISKAQRDETLRLIPKDIRDDCEARILATLSDPKKVDPLAARNKVIDAFATINVIPSDLVTYINTDLEKASPAQIAELRGLYAAIADGQITFDEAMKIKYTGEDGNPEDAKNKKLEALKPRDLKNNPQQQTGGSDAKPAPAPSVPETSPDEDRLHREVDEEAAYQASLKADTARRESKFKLGGK